MTWSGSLRLDYRVDTVRGEPRTVLHDRHDGPLRVLASLYPEATTAVCHNVLVHPPGGLVGGDTLDIAITLEAGAHALVTTPGATRFYRSDGERAAQRTRIDLAAGARFEWLPLATICSSGCIAENTLTLQPQPGAEAIGWELCALGLASSGQPFEAGGYLQQIELPGVWLERGIVAAQDHRLLHGALGLAGQRCLASIFFVCGSPLAQDRREAALEAARVVIDAHALSSSAGATSPNEQVVIVRALAPLTEPAFDLLRRVRAVWRERLWQMAAAEPRSWAV